MTRDELIAFMTATAAEKPTSVEVEGWGKVFIRSLTVAEVEQQADDTGNGKDKNRIARGVARLLCDEDGKRLFDPENGKDVDLLGAQPWRLLKQVIDASDAQIKGKDAGN